MILINPQWQGGADKSTFYGALEIQNLYMGDLAYKTVPVSESMDSLIAENGIIGYRAIQKQTKMALKMLQDNQSDRIFTVGGGCDADVGSIVYANEHYAGDIAVLWMDAHGDINSPEESCTHLFYGMPVRALLNECGDILSGIMTRPLVPEQIINFGGRELDESERSYIAQNQIPHILLGEKEETVNTVVQAIAGTGRKHLYIHLDLDVLAPEDFPLTPLPVKGGISGIRLLQLLHEIEQRFDCVGFGLFEYKPCGEKNKLLEKIIAAGFRI